MQATLTLLLALAGAAEQTVWFAPPDPRPGDLMIVYVENDDPPGPVGAIEAFGYETALYRVSPSLLRAVVAVPMEQPAGPHGVRVLLGGQMQEAPVQIVDRTFESSELTVSKRFTSKKSKKLKARLRRESRAMADLWKGEPTVPAHVGRFARPVAGEVTGLFGTRRIFNGKRKSVHYGLDLDGKVGDPVRAVADGTVVMSSMRWGSGGTIVLDHGGGLHTLYFHLSTRSARMGQRVTAGQVIGDVGKSGRVTGPHLHLSVVVRATQIGGRARSLYVDPERFLSLELLDRPTPAAAGKRDDAAFGGVAPGNP